MKIFTVFYKFGLLKNDRAYLSLDEFATLYSDEECTIPTGYYNVIKKVNPYSKKQFIAQVNIVMFFEDNILEYNYIVNNRDEINTPITYYNKWNGEGNIGKVSRVILPDNLTRKVTITINE